MPKTRINCPNCRQPIIAEINQLFDSGVEPRAKQLILSGAFNLASCPHCGYQGNVATPIVYHDPEKELLLTYFPHELSIPINEQERIIGPLVSQAMNNLPQEKRKGYLLRPQTMFTLQGLIERILESDGITREMIQDQQKRLALLQRLMEASDDVVPEIARNEDNLLDGNFFALLGRLVEASLAAGDQKSAQRLGALQEKLIEITSYGKQYQAQTSEVDAAVKSLRSLGDDLTREKLLDLLVEAPSETRLSVLVSLTRPGIDYEFFQLFTQRIERAAPGERQKLLLLREKVLELTRTIDQTVEVRSNQARKVLHQVLSAADIPSAIQNSFSSIDDFFLQAMNEELENARKSGDLERISKLRQIESILQKASEPPQEVQLIQDLLGLESESEQLKMMEEHRQDMTQEFMDTLSSLTAQLKSGEDIELADRMERLYRTALRYSMQIKMQG